MAGYTAKSDTAAICDSAVFFKQTRIALGFFRK
jgi:hypothetical protein